MYLIEMDDMKNPPENSYGARDFQLSNSGQNVTNLSSIYFSDSKYNGHINRNIRAVIALIDMAKPYVVIESVEQKGNELEVAFKINGCSEIN